MNKAVATAINIVNGRKLKQFRKDNKISVKEILSVINMQKTSLYEFEKGIRPIPFHVIQKLNKVYNMNLDLPVYPKGSVLSKRKRVNVPVIDTIETLDDFGQRLKDIRKQQHLTLIDFSKKYDLSPSHLWKLEIGKAITLRVSTLQKLSNDGVNLEYLING